MFFLGEDRPLRRGVCSSTQASMLLEAFTGKFVFWGFQSRLQRDWISYSNWTLSEGTFLPFFSLQIAPPSLSCWGALKRKIEGFRGHWFSPSVESLFFLPGWENLHRRESVSGDGGFGFCLLREKTAHSPRVGLSFDPFGGRSLTPYRGESFAPPVDSM